MPRPHRDTPLDLSQEIKAVAVRRLAEHGAAGLSLRAIARDLGITAPAIYNYFRRLDDLITALIVDAYTSLGDALAAGRDSRPAADHTGRLIATGLAYRAWAKSYRERYNLIFGTPIPGYQAPMEVTQPAAARGLEILIGVLEAARRAGRLPANEAFFARRPALLAQIKGWQQSVGSDAHPYIHYLALVLWTRVHGIVSIELHRQFPPAIADGGELFQAEIEALCREIGLGETARRKR